MGYEVVTKSGELYHHGIAGQKWGVQNGPPYPLDYKDKSAIEKRLNNLDQNVAENSYRVSKRLDKVNKLKNKNASEEEIKRVEEEIKVAQKYIKEGQSEINKILKESKKADISISSKEINRPVPKALSNKEFAADIAMATLLGVAYIPEVRGTKYHVKGVVTTSWG